MTLNSHLESDGSAMRIRVKPACSKCAAPGIGVVGIGDIGRENPRSHIIGLWAIGGVIAALLVVILIWLPTANAIAARFGASANQVHAILVFIGGPIIVGSIAFVGQKLPVRAVICRDCRRVTKLGYGRRLPLSWQECIQPQWQCTQCGYSLHGLAEEAKCPECGCLFPEEWLKFTSKADPNIVIECELVG